MRNRIASTLSGLAILALAVATTACGGSAIAAGTVEHEITIGTGTVGTTPTPTTTEPASTTPAAGGGTAPAGDPVAGKKVFTAGACVGCHTLKDAGSTGTTGPNLDTSIKAQSAAAVVTQVTNGGAAMPAFKGQLSDADIANVAAYVASVAGK
jgi:mono/diheme cytochrome c family protein